jgi:hypothetical protein
MCKLAADVQLIDVVSWQVLRGVLRVDYSWCQSSAASLWYRASSSMFEGPVKALYISVSKFLLERLWIALCTGDGFG